MNDNISNRLLRAGCFADQIPVGERLFATAQSDPGAQPTSCTGTLSRGYYRGRAVSLTHIEPILKEQLELYFHSLFGPSGPVIGRALPTVYSKKLHCFSESIALNSIYLCSGRTGVCDK
jgi:hypothetical protein